MSSIINGPKINTKQEFKTNEDQYNILDILVLLNVCESKSQARQLIQGKSIFINNKLIDNIDFIVNRADAIQNKFSYIKKGKKNYFLIN